MAAYLTSGRNFQHRSYMRSSSHHRHRFSGVFVSLMVAAYMLLAVGCGSTSTHSTNDGNPGGSSSPGGSGSGTAGSGSGSGSGSATAASSAPRFLYSSDFRGNRILGYSVDAATGALTPTAQASAPAHSGPTRIASDNAGKGLYVIDKTSNDISVYSISRSDGSLVSVPGSPFVIGETPTSVAVAPTGNYVYGATWNSTRTPTSRVYAFRVQSNGSLMAVPGSPFATVDWAQALAMDPQGKYLYVSSSPQTSTPSPSQVGAFSIGSDGALTPVSGSPYTEPNSQFCSNGAWDMAIHPSGNFLVLPNMCEGIVLYRIDGSTGTLSLVTGSPFPPPGPGFAATGDVQSIAIDPQGTFFWVTDSYCHSGCSMATDTWKLDTTTGVPTYIQ